MDDFEKQFKNRKNKADQEVVPTTADATATPIMSTKEELKETENLLPTEQGELQPEQTETSTQEVPEQQPEQQTEQVQEQVAGDENSVDYWRQKFEASESRHKDFQSYNDKRFNDLDKKFNEFMGNTQNTQTPQPEQKPQPEEKTMSNEELNDLFYDNPIKAMEEFAKRFVGQPQQQQQGPDFRLMVQEEAQRSIHDDYDEVVQEFVNASTHNPQLLEEVQKSPNKAKAAYDAGLKLRSALKIQQDPEAYEKQLREKWEAEQVEKNNSGRGLKKVPSSAPASRVNTSPESFNDKFNSRRKKA